MVRFPIHKTSQIPLPFAQQVLAPYLMPQQMTLLGYEGALPPLLVADLCARLRTERAALRTLVVAPVASTEPQGTYHYGSLLCADLSGFTALTEQLATQGRQGVEELSTIINTLFGALMEEIALYGGVVLKFSGDALTVLFDTAEVGPHHHTLACAAAFAMQQRVGAFATMQTSCGLWNVRLRVGVHSGRLFIATLGDPTRRELLVAGKDVNEAMLVQERSVPGEVLVSAETLAGLEPLQSVSRQDGLVQLLGPPSIAHSLRKSHDADLYESSDLATAVRLASEIGVLRSYLPKSIPQRFIDDITDTTVGEFRPVTVLFVNFFSFSDLLGYCEGAEHLAVRAINTYYTHVQNSIHTYGGTVNKLDVASFGERLLATFGAPLAQEDDPQRAVQAALALGPALDAANAEMRDTLESLLQPDRIDLQQQIGVATGTVFAGLVGGAQRREYTVIGQTVNLAARLMAAGQAGQVLLSPSTWRAVKRHVAVQPLPPRTLKGIPAPVAAGLALHSIDEHAHSLVTQSTELVGRKDELATLCTLMDRALHGTGSVVALGGEAGIGKSRLSHEVLDNAARQSMRCITASCHSYATTSPYSLVRDLLLHAFEISIGDPLAVRRALHTIVSAYAPDVEALTPLLYGIVGIDDSTGTPAGAPPEGVLTLPPAEQRPLLHDLLEALITGLVAQQPLVLLLDDLHWADASSLEVVQRLANAVRGKPFLLMLLYRSEPAVTEPWLALPHTTALRLEPLDTHASASLLDTLLGGKTPAALLPLLGRAQGSPFFLESLIHHLIDTGELERDANGEWQLRHALNAISIPIDIERLLFARLDQLEEQTRMLVQTAAVIGVRVTYPVLAGVYSQARQLARRLSYLVQIGILTIDEQDEQEPFRFQHTLLREVAYNSILYTTRRELHRRVAERMEVVAQPQNAVYLAELTHHFLHAEEWQRACTYSLRLACHAQGRYATTEALMAYRQAYDLATHHPDEVALANLHAALEGLADVEVIAGSHEEALAHYRALLEYEDASSLNTTPAVNRALLVCKIGNIYEHQGQFDTALQWMQQARMVLASTEPQANIHLASVCSDIGWVYFRRGELDTTESWLQGALDLLAQSEHNGDVYETEQQRAVAAAQARVLNRLGGLAWSRGDLAAARMYVEHSLAIWVALGDLLGQADAQNNLGVLADECGDWTEAIARYAGAHKVDEQIGRRREAALSLLNLGIVSFHQGDLHTALALLEQAAAQTAQVDDTLHEAMALRWQGRILTAKGDRDRGHETLQRALEIAEGQGWLLECLDTYAALGQLALAEDNSAGVESALAIGNALLPQVDHDSFETAYFLRFAAQAAHYRGDTIGATALFDACSTIFTELGMRAEAVRTKKLANVPLEAK